MNATADDDYGNVRVLDTRADGWTPQTGRYGAQTTPQQLLEQTLDLAEANAVDGLDRITQALAYLDVVKAPTNPGIRVLAHQLVEEIREVRRVRT